MRTKTLLALSLFTAPLVGCAVQPGSVGSQNSALGLTGIEIAQIYGGGGNPSAVLENDYVVLYNTTAAASSLAGFSIYNYVQGTPNGSYVETPLTGTIPAGGAYLVASSAGTTGAALPTPDQSVGTLSIADTKGTIALATSGTGGAITALTSVDLVGWGTSPEASNGTSAAELTSTTALIRKSSGTTCTDTNVNSADFTLTTLTATDLPPNSAATITSCSSFEPAAQPGPDMAEDTGDMATGTSTQDLATTTPKSDLAVTVSTVDGGDPTGNQPSATNGSPPNYKPGGSIPGAFSEAGGRGFNGCSVGGNGAQAPWFAGLLVAGFALAFRRRRTA